MGKPFAEIRGKMRQYELTQAELARRLDIGKTMICSKLGGKEEWKLAECYALMDMFNIPYERMHEVFPPNRSAGLRRRGVCA